MVSRAVIAIAVLVLIILIYFMTRSPAAATSSPPATLPSAVGKTIDLSSMSLINPYHDANNNVVNPIQVYTYNGNGVFTGVTAPTIFAYTFQPSGSSNIYVLVDNSNCYVATANQLTSPPSNPHSWAGAGIVDITSFANNYSDVTPITINANTLNLMPATYTNIQKL